MVTSSVVADSQGSVIVLGAPSPWRNLENKPDIMDKLKPLQRFKADGTWLGELKLTGATLGRMDRLAMDRKDGGKRLRVEELQVTMMKLTNR